jgi:rubrerythrin
MAGPYQLFQAAERLETLASDLYLLLADRFAGDPDARDLFRRLADEEVQHAARVRLLFAQYRNDPRLFESASELRVGTVDAERLVRETSELVRELAAGSWGDDLLEVLDRVRELEERCAGLHAQFLAAGAHPDVARFFEELATQDREHERLLGAFVRRATG